ncbi:MAG TPA: GIY-YIG nuclease family protein [Bacteroidota bacterium]|nr:GIY-YIG nuclease family protein [Bacteroidota bacterium]
MAPGKTKQISKDALAALPETPGVYLFYGSLGELLYVGKSKAIRTRVRSHFSARDERWLCRKVTRVEVRETAGELGALLLESQLIKELKPMFNVASRQRRRLVVARGTTNAAGYTVVHLEAVDYLDVRKSGPILGVFKHKTQAREYLDLIAKVHRLCPKLLRLEVARGYCFSYHLGQCGGACMGEEDPSLYNARVDAAFEERRIKAWPYPGGVVVEERSKKAARKEFFLIDNWCLVASIRVNGEEFENGVLVQHRFDYDSYKILLNHMVNPENHESIKPYAKREFEKLRRGLQSGNTDLLPSDHT